ncbi:MAG: hypothetical protein ACI93R_002512 [Flavobacteriales bacterium]|jgi:hypothetical protein
MSDTDLKVINLYAGTRPDGQPIGEDVRVKTLKDAQLQLVHSPAFVKGIASGDIIEYKESDRSVKMVQRSGNLAIRVMAKSNLELIAENLTPEIEKLGGEVDAKSERVVVYTIHISCGFPAIEKILNTYVGENTESVWFYGNVYDPADGVTPLEWWKDQPDE